MTTMMLPFDDPAKLKTKQYVFEEKYVALDSATWAQLKELSSKRRLLEESINETSSITEAIVTEMSGGLSTHRQQVLQQLEQSLPLLETFVLQVDLVSSNRKIVQWTVNLKFHWSSSLSSSPIFNHGEKFFQIDNVKFELGMVVFLYGAILRERAFEVLLTDLALSATLFRKAAGVYQYLSNEILPPLQSILPAERPIEAISSVSTVMSYICLAEAQAVATRRAEEKGSTIGLLAKLHFGVGELLDQAASTLSAATRDYKDASSHFVEFMLFFKALHELKCHKYLAQEMKIDSQVGAAIGVLRSSLVRVRRKIPVEETWKSTFEKEIDDAVEMLRKYERENEFVWHDRSPSGDDIMQVTLGKEVGLVSHDYNDIGQRMSTETRQRVEDAECRSAFDSIALQIFILEGKNILRGRICHGRSWKSPPRGEPKPNTKSKLSTCLFSSIQLGSEADITSS